MSGKQIPYKQLGFDSIPAFLHSHPDKFVLQRHGSDFQISAVIDKKLNDLARLVQGQKSSKKKKSKPQKKPTQFYSSANHQRLTGFPNQMQRQTAKTFNSVIHFNQIHHK